MVQLALFIAGLRKPVKKPGYCSYGSTEQYFELDEQFLWEFLHCQFCRWFHQPAMSSLVQLRFEQIVCPEDGS
jgi:hypothetical protein